MHGNSRIRFEAEKPLGKLAKWLRMLGFDASYQGDAGWRENMDDKSPRIRLTRSFKTLSPEEAGTSIVIVSDLYMEQLEQVIDETGIEYASLRPFSRCLRCNVPIRSTNRESARALVPDYVWQTQNNFTVCPRCGRIYWAGTHADHSMQAIRKLFGSDMNLVIEGNGQVEDH